MVSFTGPFDKLKRMDRGFARVPDALSEATSAAKGVAHDEYQRGFAEVRDPLGAGWAPTRRGGTVLYQTGALANPFVRSAKGTVYLKPGARYGFYHQQGTGRMKARKVVPDAGTAGVWEQPLRAAIERDVNGFFRVVLA